MRRWQIRSGNHIGYHFIYDTENEATIALGRTEFIIENKAYFVDKLANLQHVVTLYGENIPDTFPHWTETQVKTGDWVRTDDGRIVQVLERRLMLTKRIFPGKTEKDFDTPPPMSTVYIRLPFSSGSVYYKKDGSKTYKYIHADFFVKGAWNNPDRTSLGSNKTYQEGLHNPKLNAGKRLFAYYLAVTGNPVKAYHLTYPKHYTNKALYKNITKNAVKLFRDKNVLRELQTYISMEDFRKQLEDNLGKAGLDYDFLFEEIKRGTIEAKGGSDDHREMLKMVAETIEKIKNTPLLTASVENKNGELKLDTANTAPLLPVPNEKIQDKVKQNTPELFDLISQQQDTSPNQE